MPANTLARGAPSASALRHYPLLLKNACLDYELIWSLGITLRQNMLIRKKSCPQLLTVKPSSFASSQVFNCAASLFTQLLRTGIGKVDALNPGQGPSAVYPSPLLAEGYR